MVSWKVLCRLPVLSILMLMGCTRVEKLAGSTPGTLITPVLHQPVPLSTGTLPRLDTQLAVM
jgi:hypothetical protein